jgi:hypothetical protein
MLARFHRLDGEGRVGVVGRRQDDDLNGVIIEGVIQSGVTLHALLGDGALATGFVQVANSHEAQPVHLSDGLTMPSPHAVTDDANAESVGQRTPTSALQF